MARYAPLWQQANTYPAALDRALLAAIWPNGGAMGNPPVTVLNTLNVSVPAGSAAVPLGQDGTVALCRWDAPEVVTLNAGPGAGTSRIDLICCTVRDSALSGPDNDFVIQVLTGQAGASPQPPNVPINGLVLAQVLVPANVANLNTATLTDMRPPLRGRAFARVWRNAAYTITTTRALLTFDSVTEDLSGGYSPATGLYTCRWPGVYRVVSHVGHSTNAGAALDMSLRKSGTSAFITMGGNTGSADVTGRMLGDTGPFRCVAGDTLGVELWTNTATRTLLTGVGMSWAAFEYLGP
jgi:hypothetical protein